MGERLKVGNHISGKRIVEIVPKEELDKRRIKKLIKQGKWYFDGDNVRDLEEFKERSDSDVIYVFEIEE